MPLRGLGVFHKEYDTIICVPRPWSFIFGSRINLTITPMEVRAVFLHLVVVTMTKAIHKRVHFGLPFRRVSPQWWGGVDMGVQRSKIKVKSSTKCRKQSARTASGVRHTPPKPICGFLRKAPFQNLLRQCYQLGTKC